jgi:hypothetical protein
MHSHRAVYRGYEIHTSVTAGWWATKTEPLFAGLPLLHAATSAGHASMAAAQQAAEWEIDELLS